MMSELAAHAVVAPPPPSIGLLWCGIFALNAVVVAAILLNAVYRVATGRVYWVDALGWCIVVAHLGWIPGRLIGSLLMYGKIFREGLWPVLWAVVYSYVLAEVVKYFSRRWDRERIAKAVAKYPDTPIERGLI